MYELLHYCDEIFVTILFEGRVIIHNKSYVR